MDITQQIKDLIETEVERRVNERVSSFAEVISKKYHIPLRSILLDSNINVKGNGTCLGTKPDGKRCKVSGKYNGYCKRHMEQFKPLKRVVSAENIVKHTHPIMNPIFLKGCPACEPCKAKTGNILIGL